MDERQAILAFGALAQVSRLRIVRMLVQAGPNGMSAGGIGDALGASSSNTSFHLKELERSGLVHSRRQSRSIIYSASYAELGALIRFLGEDCCGGHPEVCALGKSDIEECCKPAAEKV